MKDIIYEVCSEEGISDMAVELVNTICRQGMGITAQIREDEDTGLFHVHIREVKMIAFSTQVAASRFINILFGKLFPNQPIRENNI